MNRLLPTFLAALAVSATVGCSAHSAGIRLAEDGKTAYVIVKPEHPSAVDGFAVDTLQGTLKQSTGADFAVVAPADLDDDRPAIFVGLPSVALARLGEADPLAGLKDQEHVARSKAPDIFLYGKGVHGNLYAVVEFLENQLGWRWYTPLEDPVVPLRPVLALEPFNRKKGFSLACRQMQDLFQRKFYYLHGMNMGWKAGDAGRSAAVSRIASTRFTHTLLGYVPPSPGSRNANMFKWQDKKDYFKTNPDFFTMNDAGRRVPNKQLCLSNPELRKELTRNILRDIDHARAKGWGPLYVTVEAADTGGHFCHCDGCLKLEKGYQSPGGPIIDYATELCELLQKERPGTMVKIAAYRRAQTQHPPVLPGGGMLPENMIVSFANIEDCYFADWKNHQDPMIQETYRDLQGWSRITRNMMTWLYPSPWGTGMYMPVGNVQRVATMMRMMHETGVRWFFADHPFILWRSGFSELQRYLMVKLWQDIDCDTDAIIREFTDHHYGAAGERMRQYIHELEQRRIDMELPPGIGEASYGVTYKSHTFDDRVFPYLTAENIRRWQSYFDQMDALTVDTPRPRLNVRTARRELDLATLRTWLALAKAYPDEFRDYEPYVARIREVNAALQAADKRVKPFGETVLEHFVFNIKVGGKDAPLPERFRDIDRARVRQFIPIRHKSRPAMVHDPDAAFGQATVADSPGSPFAFGFRQLDRKQGTRSRKIGNEEITPGGYRLYKLGEIEITPDCRISFGRSGKTHLQLGPLLYEPGAGNKWEAYASIKFAGAAYGGTGDAPQVLVDRMIFVSLSEDQFKE
jgi:hypothetical protein